VSSGFVDAPTESNASATPRIPARRTAGSLSPRCYG
jgi:hypothetical protein